MCAQICDDNHQCVYKYVGDENICDTEDVFDSTKLTNSLCFKSTTSPNPVSPARASGVDMPASTVGTSWTERVTTALRDHFAKLRLIAATYQEHASENTPFSDFETTST